MAVISALIPTWKLMRNCHKALLKNCTNLMFRENVLRSVRIRFLLYKISPREPWGAQEAKKKQNTSK